MDIENLPELAQYLRNRGIEPSALHVLTGGVSNRTVWAESTNGGAWVLKQALPKLRVSVDWYSDPKRIHREAAALRTLATLAPPDSIPALVFEDRELNLLAMQAVPRPHDNWKEMLLEGRLKQDHLEQFATILADIHRKTLGAQNELAPEFSDLSYFESLRLEPYYSYTAGQVPAAAEFLRRLVAETRSERIALVHGDYSPKNVLVHADTLILLDYEVVHFGDPAFDLGFSLTHLLSKAHHLPSFRSSFCDAAAFYWHTYAQAAAEVSQQPDFESRVIRHTLACLLARVAGRSPLEYLDSRERHHQRTVVLSLLENVPSSVDQLISEFVWKLDHAHC